MNTPQMTLTPAATQMHLLRLTEGVPSPAFDSPLRGLVESFALALGLRGWIVDAEAHTPPEVGLYVQGRHQATVHATAYRGDVVNSADRSVLSGFAFGAEHLAAIAAQPDLDPAAALEVRHMGTGLTLRVVSPRVVGDLVELHSAARAAPVELSSTRPLMAELIRLGNLARLAAARPLHIEAPQQVGFIEFLSGLTDALRIVGGWMQATQPRTCGVVVMQGGVRHVGGLCCVTLPRADLSDDFRGFVGLLYLADGWAGIDPSAQLTLAFDELKGGWLDSLHPLRQAEPVHALEELRSATRSNTQPRASELARFAADCLPWEPSAWATDALGINVGWDDVLVAPGFGVFLRGWVLCPVGTLAGITARFGDAIYELDPASLCLNERPDLASVFPAFADRVQWAGLTAVLRGVSAPDLAEPWLLRLAFDSGAKLLHQVDKAQMRYLESEADLLRLQRTMPEFHAERWLGDLASSMKRRQSATARGLHWLSLEACHQAMVLGLPSDAGHVALMLDALSGQLQALPADAGVVLMVPACMASGNLASWLQMLLSARPSLALSVCRLPPGVGHWAALDLALTACTASRFAFIGPQVLLTGEGAAAVGALLHDARAPLALLAIEQVSGDRLSECFEAGALVWDTDSLRAQQALAPPLLGDLWRDNALPVGAARLVRGTEGRPLARRIGPAARVPLIDRINQRLCLAHRAGHPD